MPTDAAPRKKSRELFCRSDGMKELVLPVTDGYRALPRLLKLR